MPLDFGMAELLAYGTLLRQGIPVRLSGQDSQHILVRQSPHMWMNEGGEFANVQ
jgi:2-oxoglutarate dehydrogenase complex dehydrogenase (E1) component-like enzyme